MCSGFSNAVREAFKTSLLMGRVPQDSRRVSAIPGCRSVLPGTACCNFRLIIQRQRADTGGSPLSNLNANFDTKLLFVGGLNLSLSASSVNCRGTSR